MSWINRCVVASLAIGLTFTVSPQAQIAFDQPGSGSGTSSVSYSHTVGPAGNLLVVGVLVKSSSDLLNTPTYNGVPMVFVRKRSMTTPTLEGWVYQYFLTNPPHGAYTLSVTTTSSADINVVSASYSGAHASQPDNSTTNWDYSGAGTSTTTLLPFADNSWTVLVGAQVAGSPTSQGATRRAGGGGYGHPPDWTLGIFDSNGPIHPAASTSMTVAGAYAGTEYGTVMASYKSNNAGLPLVHQGSLTYVGAFRVPPISLACGDPVNNFDYGGDAIGFNPAGDSGVGSLFVTTFVNAFRKNVAEISIPPPLTNTNLSALNTAGCLHRAVDPSEGASVQGDLDHTESSATAQPTGMVVVDNKLWINNGVLYDANGSQTLYALSRPLDLSTIGQVKGLYGLIKLRQTTFRPSSASKSIAAISSDWSGPLGGNNLLLSKFNVSTVNSGSWGPNAVVTDSSILVGPSRTTYEAWATEAWAGPLFYYDEFHNPAGYCLQNPPPGPYSSTDPKGVVKNGTIQCSGFQPSYPGATRFSTYTWWSRANSDGSLVQPKGTSSLLAFQVAKATKGPSDNPPGYGYGYGCGCSDQNTVSGGATCSDPGVNGPCDADGNGYWYNPEVSSKGEQGYPYVYQIVAFDMNDLVAVKNGTKNPWDLRPYDFWEFTLPFSPQPGTGQQTRLSNATYDSINNKIYIAQWYCCDGKAPIIHAFQINP